MPEGRAIASGNRTPGPYRKILRDGEKKALAALKAASTEFGEEHPIVQECTAMLLCIARGDLGFRGRHIGDRYRAICRLLDQIRGRPREQEPQRGDDHARAQIADFMQQARKKVRRDR